MMETLERRDARILVVDDEPTITEFLDIGLTYEGYAVRVAADGPSAIETARTFLPDVVVLDVMLPGLDGLEVCRRLRMESDVAILMLTAKGELEDRVSGLEIGADDYVVKPFKFREVLARIRAQLRRKRIVLPHVLQLGDLRLDRDTREVTLGSTPVQLTPREWELLELLMSHPRQVLSRETILNRVWGYEYIGDTNVVEVHISALREKLNDRARERIQTVRGVGYALRG
jgi:DNA-binding response OmpR family regulator